jgi:peroxiredoxin
MKLINITSFILALIVYTACSPSAKDESPKAPTESDKTIAKMEKPAVDLTKHGIADNPNNVLGGLEIGDIAPDFTLEDQDGNMVSLENKLKEGPVLLVFYRADWCSICRRHLAEFQDKIIDISESGVANVIAVSPQLPEYSLKLHKEHNYTFPIVYDKGHQTMKDYKVFFHVTDKYNQYITEAKGDPIELRNGNTEPVMPVPATYMIGQDKKIKYVHYDPNYRVRADIDEVLQSIES